jgi:hypothetical protein
MISSIESALKKATDDFGDLELCEVIARMSVSSARALIEALDKEKAE